MECLSIIGNCMKLFDFVKILYNKSNVPTG